MTQPSVRCDCQPLTVGHRHDNPDCPLNERDPEWLVGVQAVCDTLPRHIARAFDGRYQSPSERCAWLCVEWGYMTAESVERLYGKIP